ncbi:MAG: hypothetical protein ACI9RU_002952 [Litorivivens sp.]
MDSYSAPYDADSWSSMSGKLDAAASSSSSNYLWAALVAASLFVGTGVYLYFYVQNVACEAQLVTNTMKVDRGISYAGVASKMNSEDQAAHSAGNFIDENNSETFTDNELSADEFAMNAKDVAGIDSTKKSITPSDASDESQNLDLASGTTTSSSSESTSENAGTTKNESATSDELLLSEAEELLAASIDDEVANENDLAFAPSLSEACVGVEVTFDLQTGDVDGNYLWNFGDGNFSNAPNPTHKYAKSGSFDISLSVTSKKDGKIRSTTMKEMILINPKPNADFEWEFENTPGHEPLVSFKNTSEMATDCIWVFDEKNTTTEINPSTSYDSKGRHVVRLTAENEFGCLDEKYAYISIDSDYNLLAQETMTPREDGPQGVFMPLGLKKKDVDFKLTVYDNKQPIFESTNKFKPWDGQDTDGQIVESGSYPWVVIIYNRYGEEEKYYSGTITIRP